MDFQGHPRIPILTYDEFGTNEENVLSSKKLFRKDDNEDEPGEFGTATQTKNTAVYNVGIQPEYLAVDFIMNFSDG